MFSKIRIRQYGSPLSRILSVASRRLPDLNPGLHARDVRERDGQRKHERKFVQICEHMCVKSVLPNVLLSSVSPKLPYLFYSFMDFVVRRFPIYPDFSKLLSRIRVAYCGRLNSLCHLRGVRQAVCLLNFTVASIVLILLPVP